MSDFVPVDNDKEAELLLKEAVGTAPVVIWTRGQDCTLDTRIAAYKGGSLYTWIPTDDRIAAFEASLAKAGSREAFWNVSLRRAVVFFKCSFVGVEQDSLKFEAPVKVFKVQRRKDFRMPVRIGYTVLVPFDDPVAPGARFTAKLVDLSAGGISIRVREDQRALFEVGAKLTGIELKVRERKIVARGVIRHTRTLPGMRESENFKVGIEFEALPERDRELIAAYVLEESRKYFMTLV